MAGKVLCSNTECECLFTPRLAWQKYCQQSCADRARYLRKRETILDRQKAYYHANKTEESVKTKRSYYAQYSSKNKAKIREKNQRHYLENRDQYFRKSAERRARKLHATPSWDRELTNFIVQEGYRLASLRFKILGIKYHIDHILPLKGHTICGLHVWNNLRLIPATENLMKYNKLLSEHTS